MFSANNAQNIIHLYVWSPQMTGLELRISFTCRTKATDEVALILSENNRENDSGRYIDAISKSWRSVLLGM